MTEQKKIFELWVEGYAATGDSGTSQYLGAYEGVDFNNAIRAWWAQQGPDAERKWGRLYIPEPGIEARPSVWGCRIFDNPADAARSFG